MDPFAPKWAAGFHVFVSSDAGLPVLRPSGELDISTATVLREAVLAMLDAERTALVDLGEVTFVDCRGLDPLIECHRLAVERGLTMELRNFPRPVMRLLELLPDLVYGLGLDEDLLAG